MNGILLTKKAWLRYHPELRGCSFMSDGASGSSPLTGAASAACVGNESEAQNPHGGERPVKRVLILAGQSNAGGHTFLSFLPDAAGKISPSRVSEMALGYNNIRIMYSVNPYSTAPHRSEDFVPVKLGQGRSDQCLGPEAGLAEYLNKTYPGEEFYIIKCASGGTRLFSSWNPEKSGQPKNLYDDMLSFTSTALNKLTSDGSTAEIVAFLWMQGESDTNKDLTYYSPDFSEYNILFGKLLDGFSLRFKDYLPSSGMAVIQAGISSHWNNHASMNRAKKEFCSTLPRGIYFDTYDLTFDLDNTDYGHFDAAAMVLLGNRFGEAVSQVIDQS